MRGAADLDIIFDIRDVSYAYLPGYPVLTGINLGIRKGEGLVLGRPSLWQCTIYPSLKNWLNV